MLPDAATKMLADACGGREANPTAVAQALHGMLSVLEVPDDPAQYGPAAVYLGHGALYVYNLFEGEMAAVGAMIPPEIMEVFRAVIADVATVFRDVATFAKEQADGAAEGQ